MAARADIVDAPRFTPRRQWIVASDLVEILTLLVLWPLALLVPRRHWNAIALGFARLDRLARRQDCRQRFDHLLRVASDDPAQAEDLLLEGLAGNVLIRLSALRQTLRPRWRVPVTVEGREHVEKALSEGSGVVMWMADTVSAHHETYQGLQGAGLQTVHIGRPTHGMSRSKFGIRWINPLRQRLEQRACRDFVVIDRGSTRRGVARLKAHLSQNHIVSIRVGDQAARVIRVPFAKGVLRLAFGPFRLAHDSGAPIVPLYVSGRVTGGITIRIGPALPLASLADADVIAAAQAYAQWLAPQVDADPGAWRSWPIVEAVGEAVDAPAAGGAGDRRA